MIEILPDVLDYGLVVVFCGTAASMASAKAGAYYANGTNAFWRTLYETGMTPRRFAPSEFRDLLKLRIGLTDVANFVAGNDSDLSLGDFHPNSLSEKIRLYSPQILAFTSKAAMRAWVRLPAATAISYGWQEKCMNTTHCFVLPSPSGAARGYWNARAWQELADAYHCRLGSL